MKHKIRIMIAEDIEPIRIRYKKLFDQHPEIEVIADVGTGEEATRLAYELSPDVILMDIEMETKDAGIRAIGEILAHSPEIKIIILTIYEEDELVFSAFRLGACDYILKNASHEDIIHSVTAAFNNQSPIRADIAAKIRDEFRCVKTYEISFLFMLNILSTLTPKELDTLYLLTNGYTRKDVCAMRCVEMSTVKSQIHSILKKFDKKNIAHIITTETDRQLLGTILQNYSKI